MLAADVVTRARSMLGKKTIYALGRGGFFPKAAEAYDILKRCDCSGFAAWCYGVNRALDHPWYTGAGRWFETSAIVADANSVYGEWDKVPVELARPGMLYVWGDHDGMQGHVGVIVECDGVGPSRVVHCSAGNYRKLHDAVAESDPAIFVANKALVTRCRWVEYT